jgi:hypothetical protein
VDGFIDNERSESTRRPGWIFSHSTWRDEKSVVRWRTVAKHHETQQRRRNEVFQDYHCARDRIGYGTAAWQVPVGGAKWIRTAGPAGLSSKWRVLCQFRFLRRRWPALTEKNGTDRKWPLSLEQAGTGGSNPFRSTIQSISFCISQRIARADATLEAEILVTSRTDYGHPHRVAASAGFYGKEL